MDTEVFERLSTDDPERALACYRGPFLDGIEASWALVCRERLSARYLQVVTTLGNVWEAAGGNGDAIALYQSSIDAEPLLEVFHHHLIRVRVSQGQIPEARAAYDRCRRTLALHGMFPSSETQNLLHAV